MTNGNDFLTKLQGAIAEAARQRDLICERDQLQPGSRWNGTPPGQGFLEGQGGDGATAMRMFKSIRIVCATHAGGCGGHGHREHLPGSNAVPDSRTLCELCQGRGWVWSAAGAEWLDVIAAVLNPAVKPEATPEALEAHNRNCAEQLAARQEAARLETERRQQAERVAAAFANADPATLEKLLLGAAKPAARK
jgi:hypothetical protein